MSKTLFESSYSKLKEISSQWIDVGINCVLTFEVTFLNSKLNSYAQTRTNMKTSRGKN